MVYPKGKLPTGFVWGEDSGNGVNDDQPGINNTKPLSVMYNCADLHNII